MLQVNLIFNFNIIEAEKDDGVESPSTALTDKTQRDRMLKKWAEGVKVNASCCFHMTIT